MTNTSGWEPVDNLILVKPRKSRLQERVEASGLQWSERELEREQTGVSYCEVIAIGPGPWKRWEPEDAPQPGEMLAVKRYAWMVIDESHSEDGQRYWILQEDDVFARRTDRLDKSEGVDGMEEAA